MSYWTQRAQSYQRGRSGGGVGSRPRGGGRWRKDDDVPSTPSPPLGSLISSLRKDDIDDAAEGLAKSAVIRDCRTVASYNWLEKKGSEATVLVPGKPPLWTPLPRSVQLQEDSGTYFRDKNAARFPTHPLEPAVVTCLSEAPKLPAGVDVVACGSTLGNLLRFIRGQDNTFRILVEKVHSTVFFVRRENSPTETIPGVRGYGHSFPDAYTTWEPDVKGSASHQRVIHYSFGGLKFLVRFEADGYVKGALDKRAVGKAVAPSIDDLAGILSDSTVTSQLSSSASAPPSKLQIMPGGSTIDQGLVFDLKTRSIKSQDKDHLGDELPRLWVSQIPNFILAFHTRGLFKKENIQIRDVREDVKKWEEDHNPDLARLAELIHRVIEMVSAAPGGKLELCHRTVGTLEVRKQLPDAGDALSPEVRAKWEEASLDQVAVADDNVLFAWDGAAEVDYTACSATCGYCGQCTC